MFEITAFTIPGNVNDVIEKAYMEQAQFEAYMENTGHEHHTTFFADFAIADMAAQYGEDPAEAVVDTYNRASQEWIGDVEYFTELVMVLNLRLWKHYESGNMELAQLYHRLYIEADGKARETFDGADLEYYYDTTD